MISAFPFDWSYLYPNKSKNKPYKNLKRHAKNSTIEREPYACILSVHIQAWQHVSQPNILYKAHWKFLSPCKNVES